MAKPTNMIELSKVVREEARKNLGHKIEELSSDDQLETIEESYWKAIRGTDGICMEEAYKLLLDAVQYQILMEQGLVGTN